MRERDRIQSRLWREQLEAEERAEQERIEAPIREATEQLEKNYRELTKVYKERLVGKVPDPDRYLDPAVGPNVRMTPKQAQDFNLAQWNLFTAAHPEIYVCAELFDLIDQYTTKEKISIITVAMFERMIQRFADCGLLPERPAPVETVPDTPVSELETPSGPQMHDGFDDAGRPKQFTTREVARMSGDEYRRAFQVSSESLRLPRTGPGPKGLQW